MILLVRVQILEGLVAGLGTLEGLLEQEPMEQVGKAIKVVMLLLNHLLGRLEEVAVLGRKAEIQLAVWIPLEMAATAFLHIRHGFPL